MKILIADQYEKINISREDAGKEAWSIRDALLVLDRGLDEELNRLYDQMFLEQLKVLA
jgi:hypothetical protein